MSLGLLEKNWSEIKKKVIEPLWNGYFVWMYQSIKLDKDDFESLANYELTRAFVNYNPEESNIFTYATNILQRKAKTELTFYHREKRVGNIYTESIYQDMGDDGNTMYENIADDTSENNDDNLDIKLAEKEIMKLIKSEKEKKIIKFSIAGYTDSEISQKVGISSKEINALRKQLESNSVIRRVLRKMGYSLGGIEL